MKVYKELQSKGLVMRGYHHKSDGDAILIMFHGFTGNKTESGYMFRKISNRLEEEGIDSIRFDYFGSGESDGLFSDMTLEVLLDQAQVILDYVETLFYKKVYMLGFSMGGALVVNLLDRAEKVVLVSPAIEFYKNASKKNSSLIQLDNGNYDMNGYELNKNLFQSFKKNYSALVKRYKNPILIIQGSKDTSVNHLSVKTLFEKFDNCDMKLIKEGTHTFNQKNQYEILEERIIKFLK